ncbi:MAG: deoxyribodipyrimidine photo-lyase [Bacteroidota bacterium]|nr:deoxyribodipyrimidine photo-lyase [Bacteroidota bacterium]
MKPRINIMWFRRDLRLEDNTALYHALKNNIPVIPIFIFDKNILNDLEEKADKRVQFIYDALMEIQSELIHLGSTLKVFYSTPIETFKDLINEYQIEKVFVNQDYEQYSIDRDVSIEKLLNEHGAKFYSYKDQVIFEKTEVVKDDGVPYTIFTPYSKKWKLTFNEINLQEHSTNKYFSNFYKQPPKDIPSLSIMGFLKTKNQFPSKFLHDDLVIKYTEQRNFPSVEGTSRLGVHLRFGTISVRSIVKRAQKLNDAFLNELIWRDFYQMVLWNFPQVRSGNAFKKEYDLIEWRKDEKQFKQWCDGKTGYPIVDAGMRELNATGFMHNRVRMIVASFLTKHLLIDWRWGENYFAKKLLDYDFASNNGGWQWASGSGCDAAPYFRIFNPALQTEKFDKDLKYIRKWIPELDSFDYPKPIIAHEMARKRCLEAYGKVLKKNV